MPTKGLKGIYIELKPEVITQVKDLAARNSRGFRDEVEHALERHLRQPPKVKVEVIEPPLDQAEVKPPEKKRGRKKKSEG